MRFFTVETDIYGQCVEIGGRPPRLVLITQTGEKLRIRLSEEMAKQVAKHLYEEIGLRVVAPFEAERYRVVDLKATAILPYRKTPLKDAIRALQQAAGADWAKIPDPDAFLREISG